jgi:small subunit ribosomal protein S6
MPVVTYETMFLLDPNKASTDAEGTKLQIHHILERHGATVVVSRPWDYNHKLSYPIGKQKKGAFHIVYYTMESTKQGELERDFALQEGLVLRSLTLKLDPKWQEAILQVAREDGSRGVGAEVAPAAAAARWPRSRSSELEPTDFPRPISRYGPCTTEEWCFNL